MMLSVCQSLFFTTLLQFMEVLGYSFMHSFKVPQQHFIQVDTWTLTGSLRHFDSFLFPSCCCSFVSDSGTVAHVARSNFCQALADGPMASHLIPDYFFMQRSSWPTQKLQGAQLLWRLNEPKPSPFHHSASK